jgi:serine/threonine protein kinase
LFTPAARLYQNRQRIGMGRFGKVFSAQLTTTGQQVAAKLLDIPRTFEEDCVLFDLFTEITVLERLRCAPHTVQMLDYGVTDGSYWFASCFSVTLSCFRIFKSS